MKGIYCLLINLEKDKRIKIGALGNISFSKGRYCYIGSAQNNLDKRIIRHLSKNKKIHWHIDYFLKAAKIDKVFYKEKGKEHECIEASKIKGKPIIGFGCSDCNCNSHLFIANDPYGTWKEWIIP